MALSGVNFVRFTRHGLQAIRGHWTKVGERFEVRRQAMKLKWWDARHEHPPGVLVDLTYETIRALPGMGVYELRLDDTIGGQSNIRAVFFDPPTSWRPAIREERPMRTVWVLEIVPKRSQAWTHNQITRFRASRRLVALRFYNQSG